VNKQLLVSYLQKLSQTDVVFHKRYKNCFLFFKRKLCYLHSLYIEILYSYRNNVIIFVTKKNTKIYFCTHHFRILHSITTTSTQLFHAHDVVKFVFNRSTFLFYHHECTLFSYKFLT
jgi:hypothetical protein